MSLYRTSAILINRLLVRNVLLTKESRSTKRWVSPTLKALYRRRKEIGPDLLEPRSSFLEWNFDAEVYAFGKRLGEEFEEDVLKRALTHRSYCNKVRDERGEENSLTDNVEFIEEGEQFIKSYVRETYGRNYPPVIVESLEKYFLSGKVLAHVAFYVGLKDIVLTAEFPVEETTLADSFKSIVAALLRSSGEERTKIFVKDILFAQLVDKDVFEVWDPQNPYQHLTSVLRERGITAIEPRLCNQSAANTILANYQVGLYTDDKKLLGIGWGENVETAKETAAVDALKRLYKDYAQK